MKLNTAINWVRFSKIPNFLLLPTVILLFLLIPMRPVKAIAALWVIEPHNTFHSFTSTFWRGNRTMRLI